MVTYSPKRLRRRTNADRRPRINIQYIVRKVDKTMVDVCGTAFSGITGFSK